MAAKFAHRSPYVSVVVAARNDNHGGNMLRRMQAFIDAWLEQAKQYDLPSEIIVVEWNPPADRPRLTEVLHWPAEPRLCEVRFVEVSCEIHNQFPNSTVIPLHQMIAKNVGIRRARGQFVLATNIDIVFSPSMMQFLAQGQLSAGKFYRMDRLDVANNLPPEGNVTQLLAFCDAHILRVCAREGSFAVDSAGLPIPADDDLFPPESGIRLGTGWHEIERSDFEAYRWINTEAEFLFERPHDAAPRLMMDVEAGPSAGREPVTLEMLHQNGIVLASTTLTGRALICLHLPPEISTGRLILRVRGGSLPLLRDLRILNLRVFAMSWGGSLSARENMSFIDGDTGPVGPAVRVLSIGARQVQFAVGEALKAIEVDVRDSTGDVILHKKEDIRGNGHVITVRLGFELSESPGSLPWLLETVHSKQPQDWASSYHCLNPRAPSIRHAAYLHINGCGDFTLMSRDNWFSLRGYAEFPIWPLHIDALFCYSAFHCGMREEILREPMRTYHVEHLSGAGWTPEGEDSRRARVEAKGLSETKYPELVKWVNQMRRLDAPLVFNMGNWGLGDLELPEVSV